MGIRPLHFVIAMVAGWVGRRQGFVIQYLKAENRRGLGRPRTADELRALVVSIAVDNPS